MLDILPKLTSKKIKRLGRGFGSGVGGHTVGRGTKGHRSRTGKAMPLWFEGGQLPFVKRFPYLRGKFHFKTLNAIPQEVQVSKLSVMNGKDITPETLLAAGLIKNAHHPIRIIGTGVLTKIGNVRGASLSSGAKKAIEAAGGTVENLVV